jgi:EARP and GARP complex-interacting protein 1
LSTGTDAVANLWRVSTISSAPLLTMEQDASPAGNEQEGDDDAAPNARVTRYEATDSIYGAAWSSADAWLYCTVAYDGRFALHHVPSKEKYKILL